MVSDTVPSDERPMTGDITVVSVEPLEIEKETENALLDHVPVVGILVCTAYKKPFIKQDGGKLEQYFQSCTFRPTFVYIRES